jgi:hypothetical protein
MPPELDTGPAGSLKEPDGAPATEEIEVTPEMIEAGLPLLYGFTHEGSSAPETVREIFLTMLRASESYPRCP